MEDTAQKAVRLKDDHNGPHDKIQDLRYDIEIAPDFEGLKFHASSAFSFTVKHEPLSYLLMHCKDLDISSVEI
jgi:aminopeptidase N